LPAAQTKALHWSLTPLLVQQEQLRAAATSYQVRAVPRKTTAAAAVVL
jgi:hypothetical protein